MRPSRFLRPEMIWCVLEFEILETHWETGQNRDGDIVKKRSWNVEEWTVDADDIRSVDKNARNGRLKGTICISKMKIARQERRYDALSFNFFRLSYTIYVLFLNDFLSPRRKYASRKGRIQITDVKRLCFPHFNKWTVIDGISLYTTKDNKFADAKRLSFGNIKGERK